MKFKRVACKSRVTFGRDVAYREISSNIVQMLKIQPMINLV